MSYVTTPITNRNFLSPGGFDLVIEEAPKVQFFCQSANIPAISMIAAEQATRLRNLPIPGDELYYQDLEVNFLVDEDMGNYLEIHNWMRSLGFPKYGGEYDFTERGVDNSYSSSRIATNKVKTFNEKYERSDITLIILNSSYNRIKTVNFKDCFPVSLSTLRFDSQISDVEYLNASVAFKYTYFDIND
jgi:hypothetical protein